MEKRKSVSIYLSDWLEISKLANLQEVSRAEIIRQLVEDKEAQEALEKTREIDREASQ